MQNDWTLSGVIVLTLVVKQSRWFLSIVFVSKMIYGEIISGIIPVDFVHQLRYTVLIMNVISVIYHDCVASMRRCYQFKCQKVVSLANVYFLCFLPIVCIIFPMYIISYAITSVCAGKTAEKLKIYIECKYAYVHNILMH